MARVVHEKAEPSYLSIIAITSTIIIIIIVIIMLIIIIIIATVPAWP